MSNVVEEEVWMSIRGFEGKYDVSNMGKVRSWSRMKKGDLLSLKPFIDGYIRVLLYSKEHSDYCLIHRLVAEHFIRAISKNEVIHHVNGIKHDNRECNLRIITRAENTIRSMAQGDNPGPSSSMGKQKRFTEQEVIDIREKHNNGVSLRELCTEYNRNITSMFHLCKGTSYTTDNMCTNRGGRIKYDSVRKIRDLIQRGYDINTISKRMGYSQRLIKRIRDGKIYSYVE